MKNWPTVVAVVIVICLGAAVLAVIRGVSAPCVNGVKCNGLGQCFCLDRSAK